MMMMLRIAWRNLWRNPTRTFIAASAIALAYSLYLISNGVQDYTFNEMRHAASKAAGGQVLVQMPEYLDTQMNDQLIQDGQSVLVAIREVDGVEFAVPPRADYGTYQHIRLIESGDVKRDRA